MSGLETTFRVLKTTANPSSIRVLVAALDDRDEQIGKAALRTLLDGDSTQGHRELLRRWDSLAAFSKDAIVSRPGRLVQGIRDALLGADATLCAQACSALLLLREYDLLPALINAAEDSTSLQSDLAAQTLLLLADLLVEELSATCRSLSTTHADLVKRLEESASRFAKHRRHEILEALLLLADSETQAVRRLLRNPHDAAYLPAVEILTHSARRGVMELVLGYLEEAVAPPAAISAVANREDRTFIPRLLAVVGAEPAAAVRANLRRLSSIAWLDSEQYRPDQLAQLTEFQQLASVALLTSSGIDRRNALNVLAFFLQHGKVAARRAAAKALAGFHGTEANALAIGALDDDDAEVQASIATQIRDRNIPSAMTHLLQLLDSPHEIVRDAARSSMGEFSTARFLAAFDILDESVRRSTGQFVSKVDPDAAIVLRDELESGSRTRCLRAIGAAIVIGVTTDVEGQLVDLLGDADPFVRIEAAKALAFSTETMVRDALEEVVDDEHAAVREAAVRSLQRISYNSRPAETLVFADGNNVAPLPQGPS